MIHHIDHNVYIKQYGITLTIPLSLSLSRGHLIHNIIHACISQPEILHSSICFCLYTTFVLSSERKGQLSNYIFTKNLHSLLNQTTYTEANERLQPWLQDLI